MEKVGSIQQLYSILWSPGQEYVPKIIGTREARMETYQGNFRKRHIKEYQNYVHDLGPGCYR